MGVLTGHCAIDAVDARLGINSPDYSRSCQDTEEFGTIKNLLWDCSDLRRFRYMGNRLFDELE